MDSKNELAVFHPRSAQGVISAGYRLYMGHFRKLFRSSWVVAVIYALCMGAMGSYFIAGTNRLSVVMALLTLAFAVMATVLASYGFAAFREHLDTGTINAPAKWYGQMNVPLCWRTAKGVLWLLLILAVAGALLGGLSLLAVKTLGTMTATIAIAVALFLLFIVLLPLPYMFTRYVLTPQTHFLKTAGAAYSIGMRHLGSLFIVTLVVAIITFLLTLVVQLPANILYVANLQSQLGALQGDPLGMPDYMGRLNFVVFALMGFLQGYIHLSTLFPYYFLFGSIEKQEEERKKLNMDR